MLFKQKCNIAQYEHNVILTSKRRHPNFMDDGKDFEATFCSIKLKLIWTKIWPFWEDTSLFWLHQYARVQVPIKTTAL